MNNKITVGLLACVLALGMSACGPAASTDAATSKSDSSAPATQEVGLTKEGIVVQRADRPLLGPPSQTANSSEIFLLVETTDADNKKVLIKVTGPATLGQLPQAAVGDKVKFSLDKTGIGLTGFEVVKPKSLPVMRPQVMR